MANDNIIQLFINAAHAHPQRIAFIEKKKQLTYNEFFTGIQAAAVGLKKKGIVKGDKVLVFIPMRIELYTIVLALLYIGAVPVLLDEWVSLKRLNACLQMVPCKAIVASRKLLFAGWFVSSLRRLKKMAPSQLISSAKMAEPADMLPSDTALVTFTTGSTGAPKAANRTHLFLQAQYEALYPLLTHRHTVSLTLLPVVVLLNICLGKTTVLPAKKLQANRPSVIRFLMRLMAAQQVESMVASPAVTVALATAYCHAGIENNFVTQVITGGGPLFPEQAGIICQAFPQANAVVVFGSTEAEPVSLISMPELAATTPQTLQQKGLSAGVIHAELSVAIVPFTKEPIPDLSTDDFNAKKLPAGTSGELLVSGPHVLQQYLNNDAAQKQNKFLVNGKLWHRTGDEALLDEAGHLFFAGRCTEVINRNNRKIYPLLLTWQLKQSLHLPEAALLLKDGELLLVLQQQDSHFLPQVKAFLKENELQDAAICLVKTIPKDKRHQTKIDYEKLREML